MQQSHSSYQEPLRTPKAFRRLIGTHAIISTILLADLAGVLLNVLIGAFLSYPIWWLLHATLHLLHASLILDIGLILIFLSFAIGYFRRHVFRKNAEDAWGCAGIFIVLIEALLLILALIKTDWMMIPVHSIPAAPLTLFFWNLSFASWGIIPAIALSLLAHGIILRRWQQGPELLSYARAHPDGQIWLLIEQAYTLYRKSLTRFNPPPIVSLKTPPSFYYYQRQIQPNDLPNPEQEMYWIAGSLILNQAYIGPKHEQAEILLPFLARLLHDYNSPDHLVNRLFQLAHVGETTWLCVWLLTIPLYVAQKYEKRWEAMERDRMLDRDRFSYYCGQGKRLRRTLQRQFDYRLQNNLPDNTIPTLVERIDHLDSLIGREAIQVKALKDKLLADLPASSISEGAIPEKKICEDKACL